MILYSAPSRDINSGREGIPSTRKSTKARFSLYETEKKKKKEQNKTE
jgi:hypothetical protein